jgi:hypothetical protein
MDNRAGILALFLLAATPLSARLKTDVVVMANGDRITGEIKGLSSGVLRVDLDYVDGTLSLQWLKVARIESSQLFIVQTQDGSLYTGSIATSDGGSRTLRIAQPSHTPATIGQAEIVRMEETSEAFAQRWSGEIDLGLVYSKGNRSTQNTFGSEVQYHRERWRVSAAYHANLSSSSGAETATRNQLDVGGSRELPRKNWFYGGIGSFMQSSVLGIGLQTTAGGGIGRYLKNTNRAYVSVMGGMAWQSARYEETTETVGSQGSLSGLVVGNVRLFIFKKTNLSLRAYVAPSLTDSGRLRFNTNAAYYVKLFKNLSWNLSFYGNWDTRPPLNFSGSDYGYSVGTSWNFGYR